MKLLLQKETIEFVAESFADQLYIKNFMDGIDGGVLENYVEASFQYSSSRCFVDRMQGGGYLDTTKLVDDLFDAESLGKIAIEEITGMTIHKFPV